jgi:undecaprenyl-diphosphatase
MENIINFFSHLLPTLGSFGVWGYWIVFLVSFVEAIVIVGSFVPAALFVIFAGVLVSKGVYDLGDMIIFASVGAILGDAVSYYLGTRGTHLFKNENRFLKADHLERGKAFFKRHGDKSILIGRFLGPLRSIIPFIAGITRMKLSRFFLWNAIGGILWAASHVLLGYFFGGSLPFIHRWTGLVTVFALGSIAILAMLWVLIKQSGLVLRFWKPVMFVLTAVVLYNIADLVFLGESVPLLDQHVHDWFLLVRDDGLVTFFKIMTVLGNWQVLLPSTVVLCILFFFNSLRRFVVPLLATVFCAEATTFVLKLVVARPRPLDGLLSENDFSFPSGHATIALAFYGFLVFIVTEYVRTTWVKNVLVFAGVAIIFLIGLSRLYLGVHYISDIFGGYLVGSLALLLGAHLHQKKTLSHIFGAQGGSV